MWKTRKYQKMKVKSEYVYLDVCALGRPFDEQNYLRIHMETEAANLIQSKVRESIYRLLVLLVHFQEIEAIPDITKCLFHKR
ncbi:hypothetical protein B9J78_03585 [bacterium Unc6]|nr:hypothetical protein [bacterium Unc6]